MHICRPLGRLQVALLLLIGFGLACGGDPSEPAPSPEQIAFRSLGAYDGAGLYLMDDDGSDITRFWSDPNDGPMCIAWAPDGRRIAFHKLLANQVFVLDVQSSQEVQLTQGPSWNHCPIWSPDGGRIAYLTGESTDPDGFELHVMNADGSGATRLGTGTFVADKSVWSPDGRWVLVGTFPDRRLQLIDATTGAAGAVLTPVGTNWAPAWSLDGRYIAFTSQRDGNPAIYRMNADGTGVRQLTPAVPGISDGYPEWSNDSKRIVFHRYRSTPSTLLEATIVLVDLQGAEIPWAADSAVFGDLPTWRPTQ